MATVYKHNGQTDRVVKNLGWILKHRNEVSRVEVYPRNGLNPDAVWFHAILRDGRTFQTVFESAEICRDFINRPSWRNLQCQFLGDRFAI